MSSMRRTRTTKTRSDQPDSVAVSARNAQPALELVRLSRVAAVQKRIAAGYYDRDEVRDRLAEAVLEVIQKS